MNNENIITNKEVFTSNSVPKKSNSRGRKKSSSDSIKQAVQDANSTPASAPVTQSTDQSNSSEDKTTFYQAAKPRNPQPNRGQNEQKNQEGQNPNPRHHNNQRFNTARRRPDRGRNPQDSAGSFIQPSTGQIGPLSKPREPYNRTGTQAVKIIPLGGLEEIGKNMTAFEYGNDIFIVDMGFQFPESDMLGIDYIIPDVTYLEQNKDKIRGAFITHGHLDHTGAIPYVIQKLGFPTLHGTAITMGMARHRVEEFGLSDKLKTVNVLPGDVLQFGVFRVRPFHLIHSIPGALGLEIETPNGRIVYATDWKFDYTPAGGEAVDFQELAMIGARGVDLLFSDSTNAERPGHSISEKVVEESLSNAIGAAEGRVIVAMFSSNLSRIQQTINAANKHGRKVLVLGRSMQQNVEMAVNLKAMTIPPNTLIGEREANRFSDDKLLVLSTGSQGEDRSALVRMAAGEHRNIKIRKGDTVVISASPIPGNERSVSNVMDTLYKAGAKVVYNKILDVHTSGHANQEDLKLMLALMKPKFFMPLHGDRSKLMAHGALAEEVGVPAENIMIGDNGLVLEMGTDGVVKSTDNHVPAGYVMVDGLGVGDVGNIVLRDRQAMAQEGMFCIFCVIDSKKTKLLASPDIISRGFIYMRDNEQFVNEIRTEIKNILKKSLTGKDADVSAIRNDLRDKISKMIQKKTEREPMVIPVITEV